MLALGAKTDSPLQRWAAPSRQIFVLTPARSSELAVAPTIVHPLRLKQAARPITCGESRAVGRQADKCSVQQHGGTEQCCTASCTATSCTVPEGRPWCQGRSCRAMPRPSTGTAPARAEEWPGLRSAAGSAAQRASCAAPGAPFPSSIS